MDENKGILLKTQRLILRKLSVNDAEEMYHNWASDDVVTEYLSWDAHGSIDDTIKILKKIEGNYQANPLYFNWGIVLKDTGTLIGNISAFYDDNNNVILGWVLGYHWWGQGYMPEAASCVIQYLFAVIDVEAIKACHYVENEKSGKVMQKLGMHFTETCLDTYEGVTVMKCWYSITRDEYFAQMKNI